MNLKKVKRIIDMFFKEKNLNELTLAFKRPLIVSENEYNELVGRPNLSFVDKDPWVLSDEFVYYELSNTLVKLIIYYFKEKGFIHILEIDLFREKR
ncbi:AcrID1 family anti-CRISPR protein [Sulfolobus islandicus rod-shaped virus 1]|uniref:Uncharacterized protein 95 n=1 Tax=Sulfolobus islandicus rod-shaped virus 1 TaxID=157898 RepID=Y95_SIRV1|nr:AcrID1 family anti-CRISPR protein [Sulfolobus islandicus rod-shaped virus 1]Q8QL18.1 RecName: Full=Uncharacterized protein 95 [Sulfolobus islandicus rod-shaped virus 1]CAC93993.1 hypothetical protein [Sulfolobus islandicus rod-shaped virus 1]